MDGDVDVWADDFMNRKPSSDFLTKYILANDHVKVLNVNSSWGSGKTFFLERWRAELSKKYVCVLFNAWETDYSAEPLLALVTCVEQQTKDKLDVTACEAGRRAVDLGENILKKAVPLIAKGLVRRYVGVELDDLFGAESGSDAAESTSKIVESLIEDQAKTTRHVDEFKAAVVERLKTAAENNGLQSPAFIFIDELDRCRPTYAIELLERIKHFFELKDCRFIIASDSKQLAHSIRAVYGQGFSSERYLNRFFDAEFNLDNGDIFGLVANNLPYIQSVQLGVNVAGKVVEEFFNRERVVTPKKNTVITDLVGFTENELILVGLCKYFKVELRELNNYIRQIKSAADTIGGNIHFFWLAYLVFFKASKADEYAELWVVGKWKASVISYNERTELITFYFNSEVSSVGDLALFYLELLNADRQELVAISQRDSVWKQSIYQEVRNNVPKLRIYKDVVDLAHRLS